jgi:hypothetical protein
MAGGCGSEIWDTESSMGGEVSFGRRWHGEPDGRELEGVTARQALDFLEPGVSAVVLASRTSAVSRLRGQCTACCEWIRVREAGDRAARRWEEEGGAERERGRGRRADERQGRERARRRAEREGTARRAPAREASERRG